MVCSAERKLKAKIEEFYEMERRIIVIANAGKLNGKDAHYILYGKYPPMNAIGVVLKPTQLSR